MALISTSLIGWYKKEQYVLAKKPNPSPSACTGAAIPTASPKVFYFLFATAGLVQTQSMEKGPTNHLELPSLRETNFYYLLGWA